MFFIDTALKDAYIIELDRREDNRGFFALTWSQIDFEQKGLVSKVVQSNLSYNHTQGTLRGMHFQHAPFSETKLVRCIRGSIYDVIVDIRPSSPTFKQWVGVELTADNRRAVYVPEGCAHGFQTLEDNCDVLYQVSQFYTPSAQAGLPYNDPAFAIVWPLPVSIISDRDRQWEAFNE
jgi:dTDP-4-dehydrorhamnose 3,5-epimerase